MFERFDGSSRQIRPVQAEALAWLERNWDKSNVFGLNAGTGVGKSAIMRSIMLEFGDSVGIVPSNMLMNQYIESYPELNYVKGMDHYKCDPSQDLSCVDRDELGLGHHEDCPYKRNKARAETESTIFNPISYYYFQKNRDAPKVLVIDEAHTLSDSMMLLVGGKYKYSEFRYPKIINDSEMVAWLESLATGLDFYKTQHKKGTKKYKRADRVLVRTLYLIRAFKANPQDFIYYTRVERIRGKAEEYLVVSPIKAPKWLKDAILSADKVILLSATLLQSDLWELGFDDFLFHDLGTPIPKLNRAVVFSPSPMEMNYKTEPRDLATWVQATIDKYPNRNTIVHLSYNWAEKIKQYFPDALFNTPETKLQVLEEFKAKGGVWIASGCAEGVDLKGDTCRLNIIPILQYGNPQDPVVKKQMALPRGRLMYGLNVLKTVIQQVGRSTRDVNDHSIAVIGDSRFSRLLLENRDYVSQSFKDAIIWRDADKVLQPLLTPKEPINES